MMCITNDDVINSGCKHNNVIKKMKKEKGKKKKGNDEKIVTIKEKMKNN